MTIEVKNIVKRFGSFAALDNVDLRVAQGELLALLGPSGSGKTTLLRIIAGLDWPDAGEVTFDGEDALARGAGERGVGFVFQHYALFRHMTVADNIEFALRVRRMKAAARRQRRQELLRLVALEGMDERLPAQLSGGQQQRVAVARALAHKPEVLLLDEPFGALDAKIREELRRTIRQVQRELGITTVLVTHDQEEAFALADRIGVMNLGRLLEIGKPQELYARPATRFVATFLGAANLILARQTKDGIRFGKTPVNARAAGPLQGAREHEVVAVVRPEEVEIAATRENLASGYLTRGAVEEIVFTGALERMRIRIEDGPDAAPLSNGNGAGSAILEVTRTQHEQRAFETSTGQHVAIGVRRIHILPTPLSSFTTCATTESLADALLQQPLLVELASRMKTRVLARVEPKLGMPGATCETAADFSGTTVIAAHSEVAYQAQWLLHKGAEEILVLPQNASPPHRVLIHWADEGVRRATLAVSASILRHVSAEAIYIGILPQQTPMAQRPHGMRALLDARSEAQAVHGLEMRTELRFGDVSNELARQLGELAGQMLILGIRGHSDLAQRFGSLFAESRWPVLIVHREPGPAG